MPLIFEQLRIGGERNFGYLLGDSDAKVCVLIDPAFSPEAVVERAVAQRLTVTHIINTHGDDDHINGNVRASALTNALVAAHPDSPAMPDIRLKDGDELKVGALTLQFIYTPGHMDDHLVVYEKTHSILITGDLLFVGKVGGTNGDANARLQWDSLQRVLKTLPPHTTVWPGHDYGARPSSTLALEAASNPFLAVRNADEFIRFKREWPEYKKRMGLK